MEYSNGRLRNVDYNMERRKKTKDEKKAFEMWGYRIMMKIKWVGIAKRRLLREQQTLGNHNH